MGSSALDSPKQDFSFGNDMVNYKRTHYVAEKEENQGLIQLHQALKEKQSVSQQMEVVERQLVA